MTGMVSVAAMTLTPINRTIGPKECTVQPSEGFDGLWHLGSGGGVAVHGCRDLRDVGGASGALGARAGCAARSLEAIVPAQRRHARVAGTDRFRSRHDGVVADPRYTLAGRRAAAGGELAIHPDHAGADQQGTAGALPRAG